MRSEESMKNSTAIILLVIMALLGIFLIYEELYAAPTMCLVAEDWCIHQCWGDFSYDYCWEDGGQTYCWFWCSGYGRTCGWVDPKYAICLDPVK